MKNANTIKLNIKNSKVECRENSENGEEDFGWRISLIYPREKNGQKTHRA